MSSLDPVRASALAAAVAAARRVTPASVPALAPVTVAQWALESDWGRSAMGVHNYFGVKARAGDPSVVRDTVEWVNGSAVKVRAAFRAYSSMDQAFQDHADLIVRRAASTYRAALSHPTDPWAFADALTGVYATDPQYGSKLRSIMAEYGIASMFGYGAGSAAPWSARPVAIPGGAGGASSGGFSSWPVLGVVAAVGFGAFLWFRR